MNKIFKIIILETVILIVLLILLFLPEQKSMARVCLQKNPAPSGAEVCFWAEVAKTAAEQQKGLTFRESLEKNRGMFFIFSEEGNYPFWMKDTLIPLDIIWVDNSQEIVFIAESAQPCRETCDSIDPGQNAVYVLEINGGLSKEMDLKLGDKVLLK